MTNTNNIRTNNAVNTMNNAGRLARYGNRILADGVIVPNDPFFRLNGNDICIGNSGSGKSTGYVAPNIECATGSLVVADTKGQLFRQHANGLRARGYDVRVLDLVNPEKSTMSYNPLAYIRRYADGSASEKDILSVAGMVADKMSDKDPFWDESTRGYIAFLIGYTLSEFPKKEQTLSTVAGVHHLFLQKNSIPEFNRWAQKHPNTFAARKYHEIDAMRIADRTFGCIMSFANVALERFGFREAEHLFDDRNPFHLSNIGKKKSAVFLNVSDTDFTFSRIATLFYSQLISVLCRYADAKPDGRLDVPVRIIMDDFCCSCAGLNDFDKIISVIRSRDISLSIILQSVTQLYTLYGRDAAQTILDSCDHLLYLGGQSLETAEYLAVRAGRLPENILTMPNEMMYLFERGQKASMHRKILPQAQSSTVKLALEGIAPAQVQTPVAVQKPAIGKDNASKDAELEDDEFLSIFS